jgi:hypothetical protein
MRIGVIPKLIAIPLVFAIGLAESRAQTVARPEFEVASVKPTISNSPTTFGVGNGGGGGQNVTLRALIALAYRVQEFQISGGPGWIDSDHFDVQGKAADARTDPDQLRLMLQSLLAERFNLATHSETKESSVRSCDGEKRPQDQVVRGPVR